jgi:hypothetical protein
MLVLAFFQLSVIFFFIFPLLTPCLCILLTTAQHAAALLAVQGSGCAQPLPILPTNPSLTATLPSSLSWLVALRATEQRPVGRCLLLPTYSSPPSPGTLFLPPAITPSPFLSPSYTASRLPVAVVAADVRSKFLLRTTSSLLLGLAQQQSTCKQRACMHVVGLGPTT